MHRTLASTLRLLALPLLVAGCGTAVPDYDDPNSIPVDGDLSNVDPRADTDKDGVFDRDEGSGDANMNGVPAHLDASEVTLAGVMDDKRDTDGDGTPDLAEGVTDADGDGIPAYRDPDEGGSGGGGMDGSTGLPFGAACTPGDTCASVGGSAGCCEPTTMTCSAMSGGGCVTGTQCGGAFCGGAGACCTNSGTCGLLAANQVDCEAVGGGGVDAGTVDSGAEGGGGVTDCPDVNGETGCCSDSGKCGVINSTFNICVGPELIDPPPPDPNIDCQ